MTLCVCIALPQAGAEAAADWRREERRAPERRHLGSELAAAAVVSEQSAGAMEARLHALQSEATEHASAAAERAAATQQLAERQQQLERELQACRGAPLDAPELPQTAAEQAQQRMADFLLRRALNRGDHKAIEARARRACSVQCRGHAGGWACRDAQREHGAGRVHAAPLPRHVVPFRESSEPPIAVEVRRVR